MDFNTLKNLYIDVFHEPKVGWYDKAANLRGLEMAREMGMPFMYHLVEKNDPHKVIDMHNPPYPGQYQKVSIPPRSRLIGTRYQVAPKNIIPYSPNNKSLARVLLNKGLNAGSKVMSKSIIPYSLLEGLGFNSPAY